jgi:pilus assembly protein CpaB
MSLFGALFDALARRPSIIGGVLAIVVGLSAYLYLEGEAAGSGTASAAPVERGPVVVARRDLDARAPISRDDLEVRQLPLEAVHPQALRSVDEAAGRFATTDVAAGAQLLAPQVTTEVLGGSLARLVPPGARALSVAVSDAMAAGGLIAPGDRVDVVAIFDAGRAGRSGSSVVVENVAVLAVSALVLGGDGPAESGRQSTSNPKQVSTTMTLAVDPSQAQRIAVAEEFGSLRLVLRHPDDDGDSGTTRVDLTTVAGR